MTQSQGRGASNKTQHVTCKWTVCLTVLSCLSTSLWTRSAYAEADKRKRECLAAYSDAQEQRLRSALLAAREQLLICSHVDCPAQIVHDCSEWLSHVERDLSSVVFAVSDEAGRDLTEARVLINGEPLADHVKGRAQSLDPGVYQYSVELTGYERAEGTIVMRQSEKNRIVRVQLSKPHVVHVNAKAPHSAEPDSGLHVPAAAIVLGATALVGVAGFTYFGLSGQSKRADAEQCSAACSALIDSGKRDYIVADISLGVAVVAAGTALVITLLDRSSSPPRATDQHARSQVTPSDLRWTLRF